MPDKFVKITEFIVAPIAFIAIKMAEWFPDYKELFAVGLLMVVVPTIVYCAYKREDWLKEEK